MTKEEAIKILSSYDVNGVWADVDGKPYNAEEQAEAFDMAIQALQADKRYENGMIDADEALEYCKRAAETNKKLMMESLKMDKEERNPQKLAWSILANQFFSQQYTEWDIYVPNMIKGLADGTWKEHFEEDNDA